MAPPGDPSADRWSRRAFLAAGGGLVAATAVGGTRWAFTPPVVRVASVEAPAEAPWLRGLRIGLVTDLHRSGLVRRAVVEAVAGALDDSRVDLVLLGGDLTHAGVGGSRAMVEEVCAILGDVPAQVGVAAVPGNHDVDLLGPDALAQCALGRVENLTNRGTTVRVGGGPLYLAGVDDHGSGRPDLAASYAAHDGAPVLLLTHQPDLVMDRLTKAHPSWLACAGHLHGGQIRLPGVGPLVRRTRYPALFDRGFARSARQVYVSGGVGVSRVPVRLNCPSEITILTVR